MSTTKEERAGQYTGMGNRKEKLFVVLTLLFVAGGKQVGLSSVVPRKLRAMLPPIGRTP